MLKDEQSFLHQPQHRSAHVNSVSAVASPFYLLACPQWTWCYSLPPPRVTKDFCHCLCHSAGFSANQLILYETFQDWTRMWFQKNQRRRDFFFFFQPKNVTLTFHNCFSLTYIWTMWSLFFPCRVNIIYLSNSWTDSGSVFTWAIFVCRKTLIRCLPDAKTLKNSPHRS